MDFNFLKPKEQTKERKEGQSNSTRLLTALTDLGIAPLKLLQFIIKNLPWIAFTVAVLTMVLIVSVPEFKTLIIEALTRALIK